VPDNPATHKEVVMAADVNQSSQQAEEVVQVQETEATKEEEG
jgi:hypothetical protein